MELEEVLPSAPPSPALWFLPPGSLWGLSAMPLPVALQTRLAKRGILKHLEPEPEEEIMPRTMTMILWTMRPPGWRAYHQAGTRFSTLPVGSLTTGMRTQTSYPGFPHMTPTLWLPNRPRSSEAVMQMLKKSWTGAMTSRTGAMTSRTAAMRNQTGATTSQTGATTNLTGIESVAMTSSKSKG